MEVRDLIRRMSSANPLWGTPHIVGELAKIGIDLPCSTVAKYMVRRRKPPSATWRAFLKNHIQDIVATDFFVVPTVRNQILLVFLVLAHERRRVLHFNVTANPTAEWAAQQVVAAFPWADPPKYLLRDRDGIYGLWFQRRVTGLGMQEVLIAAQSPWQNPFVERLIGSIRRECLDHTIVLGERHLRRILKDYFAYYHRWRTHQALEMDSPEGRGAQPDDAGLVVEIDEAGGLHHHYEITNESRPDSRAACSLAPGLRPIHVQGVPPEIWIPPWCSLSVLTDRQEAPPAVSRYFPPPSD